MIDLVDLAETERLHSEYPPKDQEILGNWSELEYKKFIVKK
jgi:hypothetical protein